MCGISGMILNKGKVNTNILKKNNEIMRHRGPDGKAVWISDNKRIGFSHVRLSIVDLDSRSTQPMHLEEITIVFNGEIYNYKQLKKILEKKYSFKTTSDTEVLGYAYKEYGVNLLNKIEGMYSFAIYDKLKNETFIARDIIGQKPLVYHEANDGFYFASEIPAILNMKPLLKKNIDYTALRIFSSDKFFHIPQPFTKYKEIKKLKPAHYLIIKNGKIKKYKQYFRLSKKKYLSKINDVQLIKDTIQNMKPTDVKYASFLSGGIDSSLICSILQENNNTKVEGYTLTTKNEDPDYIRSKIVAKKIGLSHNKIIYDPKEKEKNRKELAKILGEPYFHITTIYTDQILKNVKKKHKVIFSGAGGDELYYGYNNKILLTVDMILILNKILPKQIMKLILPKKYKYLAGSNLKNIKKRIYLESYKQVKKYPDKEDLGEEYIEEIITDIFNYAEIKSYIDLSYVSGLITENSHSLTIPGDLAGMKNSIEIRNPFLEKKLLERAYSIPLWKKTKITKLKEGKEILRKALLSTFPKSFVYAKKYGFGTELEK